MEDVLIRVKSMSVCFHHEPSCHHEPGSAVIVRAENGVFFCTCGFLQSLYWGEVLDSWSFKNTNKINRNEWILLFSYDPSVSVSLSCHMKILRLHYMLAHWASMYSPLKSSASLRAFPWCPKTQALGIQRNSYYRVMPSLHTMWVSILLLAPRKIILFQKLVSKHQAYMLDYSTFDLFLLDKLKNWLDHRTWKQPLGG